ncbi:MAG: heme exporter protein CcmB [Deltaproteobacteria bacterium]|nr:heme exporter protein CcmB [Deltaproteobacteria bacterium]MBW2416073.1 heme exporter protein CcmB [Deltaproteobacteria bacterium]
MNAGPRVAAAVLGKDLRLDLRSKDRLGHMAVFSALVVVLLSISLPPAKRAATLWIPALMWVVFLFTSLLGLSRSFLAETAGGALATLSGAPCDRGWIFLGKAGANFVALLGVEIWTAVLFSVFLGVDWSRAVGPALGVALLGAAGLASVGTLLSALSATARFREFLLPVLLFPLILPVLVFASQATADALAEGAVRGLHWGALALYAWVFTLAGYFVFDHVLED